MPTPTYSPLATVTLGASASSVTFSSIPATYRDLILVSQVQSVSGTDSVGIRLNGDATTDKSNVFMNGSGSSASSYTQNNAASINAGDVYSADRNTVSISQIFDYSATDKHKTVLTRFSRAANNVIAIASRQPTTSAITSVVAQCGASFASGSTFSLYGVIA
jgi:hypothetical protein